MPPFADFTAALLSQPRAVLLVALLLGAAVVDTRTRRIPNALCAAGAMAGLALAIANAGAGPAWLAAIGGCMTGLALMLPLYALRTMGAGDVKLMAAAGAFLGPADTAFAVLLTFIAGGALAIAWVAWHRKLAQLCTGLMATVAAASAGQRVSAAASVGRMPYAIAICAGTLACVWLRQPFSTH